MDISKQYIKMCREAKEIQQDWGPSIGDYIGSSSSNHGISFEGILTLQNNRIIFQQYSQHPFRESTEIGILNTDPCIKDIKGSHVWLPRQDQLQDMAKGFNQYWESANETDDLIQNFHEWFEEDCFRENDLNGNGYSMEQLWLCLVMNSKYKKSWNKEKQTWITA